MKSRLILIIRLACAVVASLIVWLQHARLVDNPERQAAIHTKLEEIYQHLTATRAPASDVHTPGLPTHHAQKAGDRPSE